MLRVSIHPLSFSLLLVFRIPLTTLRIFYKSHRVVCLCMYWSVKQAYTVTVKCCWIFFTIRRIATCVRLVSFRSFFLLFGSTEEEQKKLIKFFMDVLCSVAVPRVKYPSLGSASRVHSYLCGRRDFHKLILQKLLIPLHTIPCAIVPIREWDKLLLLCEIKWILWLYAWPITKY